MNYDALSIDELDALSIELKAEIEALRERRRAIRLTRPSRRPPRTAWQPRRWSR